MLNGTSQPGDHPLAIDVAAHYRSPKAEVASLEDAVERWILGLD